MKNTPRKWQTCEQHKRTHPFFERTYKLWNLETFYGEFYAGQSRPKPALNDLIHTLRRIQVPCELSCFSDHQNGRAKNMEKDHSQVKKVIAVGYAVCTYIYKGLQTGLT